MSLPRSEFDKPVFRENLVSFLEKASLEPLDEFAAKTRKAGVSISEARATVDPALITHFLMTLLEVNGSHVYPPFLRKRIKDDVCWDNAELPWRRNPFWLILRVSVQRSLYLALGEEKGRVQYKFLMCMVLAGLLVNAAKVLNPELCGFLRAKLCRRLAKLESEKETLSSAVLPTCTGLFENIGALCQHAVETVTSAIDLRWNAFKTDCRRKIPSLPYRARDNELYLSLPNSGSYLQSVLDRPRSQASRLSTVDAASLGPNSSKATTKFFDSLTTQYFKLEDMEESIEFALRILPSSQKQCEKLCLDMAAQIRCYLYAVEDAYEGNTEQISTYILNIFELWVHMDKCATVVHPLLREYHPCFEPEMLDVLLLSRLKDMQRLQAIQQYIHGRCTQAGMRQNVFTDPEEGGCFANRYFDFDQSWHLQSINQLQKRIETASSTAKKSKEKELQAVNDQYKYRTEKMGQTACTQRRHPDGSHDICGCSHCWHVRCRRRLEIQIHEDFLPLRNTKRDIIQKRAIMLELDPPAAFSAYRDATWEIINHLCPQTDPKRREAPEMLLKDYSQLRRFNKSRDNFSLASRTKSYLGTHYNFKKLPANSSVILLPLGLTFSYYDSRRGIWASLTPNSLTFAHHFTLNLPKELSFSSLYSSPSFAADGNGPTSYEAIASITECPSELTVHEYTAHQSLVAGRNTRWLSMLTELASSNVNFSLPDTMVLFHHLALQVGPRLDDDHLRAVHTMFKDARFCQTLLDQIERHVDAVSANWREINYMETMLTLTLRVCTLGAPQAIARAKEILLRVRHITLSWITRLRYETRTTQEVDVAERTARYGFMSALLCRRTFFSQAYSGVDLDGDSFKSFVEATLAMQENLVVDLNRFSTATRNMLVRDIKMTFRMRAMIRRLAMRYPSSVESAIDTVWPNSEEASRPYTCWRFLQAPYGWWITSTVAATMGTAPQEVHYHVLEGHLLVDGKPSGKLPADIRDSEVLKELFGNQRLVAFPSNLPEMSYVLGIQKEGYSIHLGYREQQLVVQCQKKRSHFEFIPRNIFGSESQFDLPGSLVYDCVHWLDLHSGELDVRRKPKIWISTYGNWKIDLRTRLGLRRRSYLVNPQSRIFGLVAQTFCHFAQPQMLTVVQPPKRNLSVEIKNMDLRFEVNRKRLLQCKQLASEMDPDQDAGTLYGLQSMIVFRETANPSQRSIITTLGKLKYRRCGIHVNVRMDNDGEYARYKIDGVLGRLHCLPEPRLLYHKAQLHAFTSFVAPDPLTGRTGTEEALRCLQSGLCQPWNPLNFHMVAMLQTIANLTPRRHYYPKGMKRQQTVSWDPDLTTTIQHDAYKLVVDSIVEKSQRLWLFQANAPEPPKHDEVWTIPHLRERAHWRRSLYERPEVLFTELSPPLDRAYTSRGKWTWSLQTSNAREILTVLCQQPSPLRTAPNLKYIVKKWQFIGGYNNEFAPSLLNDCLGANLAQEWGSLVKLCRNCKREDLYNLMFRLGVVAFRKDLDMRVLRTAVAFFILDDLKMLDFPDSPSFAGTDMDQKPESEELSLLVRPLCKEYQTPSSTKNIRGPNASRRLRDSKDHDEKSSEECEAFAHFLLKQWPDPEPSVQGFDATYLNVDEALKEVLPLWQRFHGALQFSNHIDDVQTVLDRHYTSQDVVEPQSGIPEIEIFGSQKRRNAIVPRLGQNKPRKSIDTRSSKVPRITRSKYEEPYQWVKRKLASQLKTLSTDEKLNSTAEIAELERIIRRFVDSDCSVRSDYGGDLKQSINAFKETNKAIVSKPVGSINFDSELGQAYEVLNRQYCRISDDLTCDPRYSWLQQANLWPSVTPMSILELLRSNSKCILPKERKCDIINYARAIVRVQCLLRMKHALLKGDEGKFRQEYDNPGHVNWDPSVRPDWLLLEIDANMQIRADQVTVALEMISPNSGANSVLQMNMGQGKTSVIMPMVACVLADKHMLTRLLVPKALLSQTAQILQSRLGGLLGKEVTHVPFSRRTPTTQQHIQEYRNLHEEMMRSSGIMLAIPEHVLSFKLCGLQRVSDLKSYEASQMVAIQRWMDRACRDILDECDFTLATRTQLVYPSGAQLAVDGHPHRWRVSEAILSLVAHHLRDMRRYFPQSIDVIERGISEFPVAYFLRSDVESALTKRIVDDVCAGQTSILPIRDCSLNEQWAIREFISQETVGKSSIDAVSRLFPDAPNARKNVYIVRGLLVHGILLLCLKKRWNVQYGLHPGRDPVAVPFHAKGVPSEQAEWGHPDVAIVFTCLAFYYQGLNPKQLRQSLQVVLKSDDPTTEYDQWTQTSTTLPDALRHWNIINADDEGQIAEIWRHLRYSTVVINHFLNHFVFPAHAKQFNIKLQASGWDVPLFSFDNQSPADGGRRPGVTTGFSGTNDNRRLLPMTIKQHDLEGLSHTNAEVLTYLLQKRNRSYFLAANQRRRRFSELELLDHLKSNSIRVLIDAGAYILESDNRSLVRAWLQKEHEVPAAVYFGSDNKAWVQYSAGKTIPLLASPFADSLDNCLVYLDEAHTRGTDLKLPANAKGVLTLGLSQTKDHTVQGRFILILKNYSVYADTM